MKIEHIAIWTKDLDKMKIFYEEYFKGIAGKKYCNSAKCFESYFICFKSGARLELMRKTDSIYEGYGKDLIGFAHMAFSVGSREAVDELTARLMGKGYTVVSGPRKTGDGYYESCVLDPEGNRIEITI